MEKKETLKIFRDFLHERRIRSDVYFVPKNIKYLSTRHQDIDSAEDVMEYLKAEYHEMLLYASNAVIESAKGFISSPSRVNFLKVILAMRKDLWIKNPDLKLTDIRLNEAP